MRSAPHAEPREGKYTPKRKKEKMTCAERPTSRNTERKVPDQKEKNKKRRVRSALLAEPREGKYTPKRKKQEITCAEHPKTRSAPLAESWRDRI